MRRRSGLRGSAPRITQAQVTGPGILALTRLVWGIPRAGREPHWDLRGREKWEDGRKDRGAWETRHWQPQGHGAGRGDKDVSGVLVVLGPELLPRGVPPAHLSLLPERSLQPTNMTVQQLY